MDNSLPSEDSKRRQTSVFHASQLFFNSILQWLAGFILLTEEEQQDAGIYPGNPRAR